MARYAVPIGLAAMLAGFSLFAFWRNHVVEDAELGAFLPRMEAQVAAWEAQKVPASSRVFNLVLSDAEMAAEPLRVPDQTGFVDRFFAWSKRTLLPRREAPPTTFAKAWAERPNTMVWTHDGFATASEGAMMREMAKAIVRAHDAGAEVNIVAQGVAAVPVIRALKSLEGVRRGGEKVGVNKVVLVGMSEPRLRLVPSISGFDFMGLGNVMETADVWAPQGQSGNATMQVYAGGKESSPMSLEELYPQLAGRSGTLAELLPVLENLVERVDSLEQIIVAQQQLLGEAEAKRAADEASAREAEAARLAQEAAQKAAEAKMRQVKVKSHEGFYSAKKVRVKSSAPQGASDAQKRCAQCCADRGGSWRWGSEIGTCPDNYKHECFQALYGCCNGAEYLDETPSCLAAQEDGYCVFYHSSIRNHGFRCAGQ